MGKRTPSWKNESPTEVRDPTRHITLTLASLCQSKEDVMARIAAEQDAASSSNTNLLIVLVALIAVAAGSYQYTMVTMASEAQGKNARPVIEGVKQDKYGFTALHRAAEKSVDTVKGLFPDEMKSLNVTDKWNEVGAKGNRHAR